MWGLFSFIADFFSISDGIRAEQKSGRWSWAKFAFALAFATLEGVLVVLPLALSSHYRDRYFLPVFLGALVMALANFGWFIPLMRRWQVAGRQTSTLSAPPPGTR